METIKLDLVPGKKMPSLHASQYDDGRDYHIDLTENRVPYALDGTETISLTVRKCDNTLVTMDIANTFADKSYIEFRTTEQMNACAGFNYGEITIEKNGTQISSLNFYLQVEGAPDEGGITSQSEINNLARQVHDIVVEELEDNGASETGYDNTESGLEATNVQDAIDEVNTKIENIPSVDAYTKQESDDKFATKTALQTVANAVSSKADATATAEALGQLAEAVGEVDASLEKAISFQIISSVVDLINYPVMQGYLNAITGEFTATTGTNTQKTTAPIYLLLGIKYAIAFKGVNSQGTTITSPRAICIYNEDGTFSRSVSLPSDLNNITLRNLEKYIRINTNVVTIEEFNYYPAEETESKELVSIKNNVVVPQINEPYIGARRCAVSFILDGDYDMNSVFEALFSSNGVKIGFAPQFNTGFPNNSKQTYLNWQEKGHEILAHSSYTLKDGDQTDELAEEYIKNAYVIFSNYGFKVNGLIGSGGKIADKYLPTVKRYFRYCASENNHSGSYEGDASESCLYFSNSPFHLWRYSMQSSTLAQMKAAVDRAISTTGLLLFYGHAKSDNVDNFTVNNIQELLSYIKLKSPDITVCVPNDAVNQFYSIRYEDINNG